MLLSIYIYGNESYDISLVMIYWYDMIWYDISLFVSYSRRCGSGTELVLLGCVLTYIARKRHRDSLISTGHALKFNMREKECVTTVGFRSHTMIRLYTPFFEHAPLFLHFEWPHLIYITNLDWQLNSLLFHHMLKKQNGLKLRPNLIFCGGQRIYGIHRKL